MLNKGSLVSDVEIVVDDGSIEVEPVPAGEWGKLGGIDSSANNNTGDEDDSNNMHDSSSNYNYNRYSQGPTQSSTVSRASYPVPQALLQRLQLVCATAAMGPSSCSSEITNRMKNTTIITESIQEALTQLVSNCIEAMDAMYFSAPPKVRKHPSFQHRLCIRVKADVEKQTLTMTDLGAGMTRADLINSLGIGKQNLLPILNDKVQSQRTSAAMREEDSTSTDKDDNNNYDCNYGGVQAMNTTSTDEDNCMDEDSSVPQQQQQNRFPGRRSRKSGGPQNKVSCVTSHIGGFYAAFCTLGVGVKVGTKSKFDDYYEFEIGSMATNGELLKDSSTFSEFHITRPHEEGTKLSVNTPGFENFEAVRGDSGTSVTIRLNEKAIAAGMLDESTLKSIFTKIIETTQYTVAFSSDEYEAQRIIDASKKEEVDIPALMQDNENTSLNDEILDDEADDNFQRQQRERHKASCESDNQYNSVKERAKYIPLRLSLNERKMLRLLESTMSCCDYTTKVDRKFKSTARRTHEQLKGVTSVLRGIVTACDYTAGQELTETENYAQYERFYKQLFEIARRHKIMNPDKMRTEYGKLIYLLQDTVSPSVQPHLGFSTKTPIESVYKFLEERNGLALLTDKHIQVATAEILAEKKTRARINQEIKQKERAVEFLKRTYKSGRLSAEDIHLCLYSICDNNSFLNSNRVPIDKIIEFLKSHFSPTTVEEGYSLSILSGENGSRLSHNHERQYYFALQSLTLWRDIVDDMFRLWVMAENDLLSAGSVTYNLQDTGQGMQRVQQSPSTYHAMQKVLVRVQKKVSHWVGSSVIHLGDHNVPNALSFIDKYTQVSRILGPIVSCLENLERIYEEDGGIKNMVDVGFGGFDKLRKDILYDFFRSAFDGSGADNFYDAGSCIDGRLTSAWNWCSQLHTKRFYPIFKLTGFTGFDGEFK